MDNPQQCSKKRRLSSSDSSYSRMHRGTGVKRTSNPDTSLISEASNEDHRDSGIASFLMDDDSNGYAEMQLDLETNERLNDSPMSKNLGRMSVFHIGNSPRKPSVSSTHKDRKVLLASNTNVPSGSFVTGSVVAAFPDRSYHRCVCAF